MFKASKTVFDTADFDPFAGVNNAFCIYEDGDGCIYGVMDTPKKNEVGKFIANGTLIHGTIPEPNADQQPEAAPGCRPAFRPGL